MPKRRSCGSVLRLSNQCGPSIHQPPVAGVHAPPECPLHAPGSVPHTHRGRLAPASRPASRPARTLNPHSGPPGRVPNLPRLRALALFGRRPPECDAPLVMPASKNQHTSGHCPEILTRVPAYESSNRSSPVDWYRPDPGEGAGYGGGDGAPVHPRTPRRGVLVSVGRIGCSGARAGVRALVAQQERYDRP